MADITQIPDAELAADLAECEVDVIVCNVALAVGVTAYSGGPVQQRKERNLQIMAAIRAEQARRRACVASGS